MAGFKVPASALRLYHRLQRLGYSRCLGLFFSVAYLFVGCTSAGHWVKDPPGVPSCLPDRLLTWDDFSKRSKPGGRSAETAIRFHISPQQPVRILAEFDPHQSWVKPELAYAWNPFLMRQSERL